MCGCIFCLTTHKNNFQEENYVENHITIDEGKIYNPAFFIQQIIANTNNGLK